MRNVTLGIVGAVLSIGPAFANPYDDCILQYMGSAKEQSAVYDIERACISKSSVVLTQDQIKDINNPLAYPGSYNTGYGYLENGLVIEFNNFTSFDITSVDIIITAKVDNLRHDYVVSQFLPPEPPGTMVTGLPEPALAQIIKSGASTEFFVKVPEVTNKGSDFLKNYTWNIIPIEGIPSK